MKETRGREPRVIETKTGEVLMHDAKPRPRHSVISMGRSRTRNMSESSNISLGFGLSNKKEKKPCGVLSGEVMNGIKYAIVWTIYVLIGSYLFLVFEREYRTERTEHPQWTRYKGKNF